MKELCDYFHSLGLKTGIYSTPWTRAYWGYPGGSADNRNGVLPDIEKARRYDNGSLKREVNHVSIKVF